MRATFVTAGLGLALALTGSIAASDSKDAKTIGRVKVAVAKTDEAAQAASVAGALESRYALEPGQRFPLRRVLSVRPRRDGSARFDATIYDYAVERAFDLVLDKDAKELSRTTASGQPARSFAEGLDASSIVARSSLFGDRLDSGELVLYEAMPGVSVDDLGRRLINVGVMSPAEAGKSIAVNEVVSVYLPTAEIVRYPTRAPNTSRAASLACGPPRAPCSYAVGPCPYYQILWPDAGPVWKLNIRHPSCTQFVQGDGTGLEITDVYYKGKLVLKRGEMPVLNVKYDGDVCGPFRDWFFSEDCFQVQGSDVPAAGSGIRVASSPPSTICGTEDDGGNFKGVAIYDEGDSLLLMTEAAAGWYHYTMEWRFHLDGTIEPLFGVTSTANSCTCNLHRHHAYWRLEWAPDAVSDGVTDDPATGIATLERRRPGSQDDWDQVPTEETFIRPASGGTADWFRIRNPATGNGYVLTPGVNDEGASGDAFAEWDLAGLTRNAGEIDDPNMDSSIRIDPWLNAEPLGATKRLVTWYHAAFSHDDPEGAGEPCLLGGPKLVPINPCAGKVVLDSSVYGCGGSVGVTLTDSDLAGQGAASVSVSSASESLPESLSLVESPPGSGRFTGAMPTSAPPAVHGDGSIGVFGGDAIHVVYADASYCGAPDVVVEALASSNCEPPVITNVHAIPSNDAALILWDTSEPATSVVHFGATIATSSTVSDAALLLAHQVSLTGLAECRSYYYWVESADAFGYAAGSNAGGGTFAFTALRHGGRDLSSADTPLPIPDDDPAGATSAISVADTQLVTDVNVVADITHANDGDLTLSLITPAGASIALASRRGQGGADFSGTVFDDGAATPIAAGAPPFTGSYQPDAALSAANGVSAAGIWKLEAQDQASPDSGTIDAWTLSLTYPPETCASPSPPPPVPDGSFGTAMTASRASEDGMKIQLAWDTGVCPARNYHLIFGQLSAVASYALSGSACGLGPLGSYVWEAVPAGDLWFVAVSDDAIATEGTWGTSLAGSPRNGATASGECGCTARSNAATCP